MTLTAVLDSLATDNSTTGDNTLAVLASTDRPSFPWHLFAIGPLVLCRIKDLDLSGRTATQAPDEVKLVVNYFGSVMVSFELTLSNVRVLLRGHVVP